ncbi:hypothetical protein A2899_01375 [Candidatus Amesbacteria bacterium RIFCSPLOWO2_01_FULL_49_25]|uniref:General secretion pathway GspH domain-containing protein n=1 Tax=Candidatus Amesbacteria bacterium RIFCSPHIGHO2_01_FULL_48_32b TaxID=1797253 RepID=A0A1F4YG48_9BACT|nr:MAG: hypothetical protein A2876_01615 [Candidatus Amesbacteria bacterium RIFCSPHIGHO2_01_FULL_48_32b]OGD07349.1 MAG: hypothetical protein A2899_01375 [Candidatus Amesbacteria bacterium RIFCSPLOWO2_01_FULL_49_25]
MNFRFGFTLVEILVAIGLLAVIGTSTSVLLMTSLRGARKATAIAMVKNEAEFAQSAMGQMVRYAKSITSCSATKLDIVRLNGDDVSYQLTGGVIASSSSKLSEAINLTSDRVAVSGCTGTMFSCSGNVVNVCFTANAAKGIDVTDTAGSGGIKFDSSITLRNAAN